ncbi:MAG: hypothetical protein RBT74_12290 [Tenuifilaceae bacterium]|jgi:ketosteroid isomerase-like protein|nr:hypothetical protein [Tenuifilaceae bacterium]
MKSAPKVMLVSFFALCACTSSNVEQWEKEIIAADKAFSAYSVEHGANNAFLHYAANDVVLLKPNMMPIVGHQALEAFYQEKIDSTYTLQWDPSFAKVSKSGDLGYTYGVWELFLKAEPENIRRGTYLTIWEHQPDGNWKFVLDTGNQGVGE